MALAFTYAEEEPLLDRETIAADLEKLVVEYAGRERELRTALAQRLKAALLQGRAEAERQLLADRHGRRCSPGT